MSAPPAIYWSDPDPVLRDYARAWEVGQDPHWGQASEGVGFMLFNTGVSGFDFDIDIPSITLPTIKFGGGSFGGGGAARERVVAIVNAYETAFAANMEDYKSGRLSAAEQARRFDALWNEMVNLLSPMGNEGQRAIADRQQGGKFDWFSAYRSEPKLPTGKLPGVTVDKPIVTTTDPKITILIIAGILVLFLFVRR